jgi:hypothetical protein
MSNIIVQLDNAPNIEVNLDESEDIMVNVETPEIIEVEIVNGLKGDKGDGVAVGGDTGQFLRKKSDNDFDTEWASAISSVIWGDIIGDIEDQEDLQDQFDTKSDTSHNHALNNLSEKSYNNLTDKPTIPDQLSDLLDDSTHRVVTDIEKGVWDSKQNALGYTPENVANLRTSFQVTPDDIHYISEKLAKDSLDGKSSTGHNHNLNDLAEKSYNSLTDKPVNGAVSTSYAPANPSALTGVGTFMFGLGSTLVITPLKTGRVMFFFNFIPTGAGTPSGMSTYQLAYGTGAAPANGGVATGTNFDSSDSGSNYTASISAPQNIHTHCFIISGLVVGTAYWFDVKGTKATGATNIGMSKIRCSIIELPY